MCIMVAFPMRGTGTGIKPIRVAPRNTAIPPRMPATTIRRVSRRNIEPRRPSEIVAMPFLLLLRYQPPREAPLKVSVLLIPVLSKGSQRRGEAAIGGRPATVDQHERARNVGACLGGEVDHRPDEFVWPGLAPEDALRGIGVVPVGVVFDLGGQRRLDYAGGNGVHAHPSRS